MEKQKNIPQLRFPEFNSEWKLRKLVQKPVKLTIQNRSKLTTYLAGEIFSTVSDLDC